MRVVLGLSGWTYSVPVPSLGGFAQFPAPLWGASGLFFGSVPVGILRPRSNALGTTYLWSY
ncbi:hypothetical protein AB852_04595 [Streptomyces uncialis]|uniref:Uncharacterized protein n=1 Tax=Streptomyces uncialis TaxID=1048205 RepID=A0A1Q4VDU1_9ACTN|nr:hypothetical protein AB852_04595 [Streptomyces uncialis]